MALDDGSTQSGDRDLSEGDVAELLTQRRAAKAEPEAEAPAGDESPDPEQLRREALGEDEQDLDTEAVDDDVEDPIQAEDDQDDDDPNPDAEDGEGEVTDRFESIDEVAEAAGMDLNEFLDSIKVNTVVDGEEGSVTLAQLVKGHQLESSFTRKNQEFLQQKKADEEAIESERAKVRDHFQMAATAFQLAQEELMSDYQAVNWDELAQTNPAEWTLKRQQLGERQARLNQKREASQRQVQEALQAQQAQEAAETERRLEAEHEMLLKKIPDWKDEKRRVAEATEVGKYLASAGYSDDEISSLNDHRLVVLARAALGLQGPSKKKLDLAKKKVDQVPRLVKPGSAPARQGSSADKAVASATAKLRKTGDDTDAAQVLIARAQKRAADAKRSRRRRTG